MLLKNSFEITVFNKVCQNKYNFEILKSNKNYSNPFRLVDFRKLH